MRSKYVLYNGRDATPPVPVPLRAGPLSLIYLDGDLRTLRLGEREVIRRIYVAVRDPNWGTVPGTITNLTMDAQERTFHITYDVSHHQGPIDFTWHGDLHGREDGTITFAMDGVAHSTFRKNRIGFCVLHPMACAGEPCRVIHTDGTETQGRFPRQIAPHQPFENIRAISHRVDAGIWARVDFEGDVFEMEDQRNWTDASFKTYSTPLVRPFPVTVETDTKIRQKIIIRLESKPSSRVTSVRHAPLTVRVAEEPIGRLPRLGLGATSRGDPLSKAERDRLKALNLQHLRVDLHLGEPRAIEDLARVTAEAQDLGVGLEAAVFFSGNWVAELAQLRRGLETVHPPIARWLVFDENAATTPRTLIEAVRSHLRAYQPDAPVGGGTNAYFTELNRNRPPVDALDLVAYSLNPQVHAFDDLSLIEAVKTQAVTVASARSFIGNLPVAVSPLTLKPRFNPNATEPDSASDNSELPPQVDVRQMSLLGAVWTMGSLKYLAEAGVDSATYYETTGQRGVIARSEGQTRSEDFPAPPGSVYPLYHVLRWVGEFAGADVLRVTSSERLRADGLALQWENRRRILLANMTWKAATVTIHGLSPKVTLRRLDETTADEGMMHPHAFKSVKGEQRKTREGILPLALLPYAITCLDS
jgi:hypothetical protein